MNATATATRHPEMLEKIAKGQGFIAALDQSGGSTPGALKAYGVGEDAYSSEAEMFDLVHQMRSRIITAPSFGNGKVIGAILFEKTMDGTASGKPVPELLWERGVVPFLKVDKGLADEADGVQLMKPNPDLEALLDRALTDLCGVPLGTGMIISIAGMTVYLLWGLVGGLFYLDRIRQRYRSRKEALGQ